MQYDQHIKSCNNNIVTCILLLLLLLFVAVKSAR
jgi:hypothetical protein